MSRSARWSPRVAGGRAKSRRLASGPGRAARSAGRRQVPGAAGRRRPARRVARGRRAVGLAAGLRAVRQGSCGPSSAAARTGTARACGQRAEPCAACGKDRPGRLPGPGRAAAMREMPGRRRPRPGHRDPSASSPGWTPAPAGMPSPLPSAARLPGPHTSRNWPGHWKTTPALLTGDGHLAPLRAIPRFIELLHAAGVAGIARPACARLPPGGAHRQAAGRRAGLPDLHRAAPAPSRAHAAEPAASPSPAMGRAGRCAPNCFITDPANLETCTGCGRRRPVERRTPDGPLVLPAALRCRSLTCSICGQTHAVRDLPGHRPALVPGLPAAAGRAARPAAAVAAIASGTLDRSALRRLHPARRPGRGCPVCSDPGHPSPGQCARCIDQRRLDELMGPAPARCRPGLQALRREIASRRAPRSPRCAGLTKPSIAPVLSGLADGRIPLTHQALDGLPPAPGPRPPAADASSPSAPCPAATRR